MISQEITINGKKFRLTLTDQAIIDARRLKALYNAAYEDPESFEEVSSAISDTITQLSATVEPKVTDNDLDGVIQAIMKVVEDKRRETAETKSNLVEDSMRANKPTGKVTKTKKSKK